MKDLALSLAYRRMGESAYSGVISNLGRIVVPAAVEPCIESFAFLLNPSYGIKTNCALVSFRDTLWVSFGSVISGRDLERNFFTQLVTEGIRVKVSEM